VLEITESQIMADIVKPLEVLSRLRLKGVGLSIDDYGTGASSMQQLKRIPFTELKIDREFVTGAPEDKAARTMLASSIRLGKDLGLAIVAEGVETESEWQLVVSGGVDAVQGFFVAEPMSATEMEGWLRRQRTSAG
jgi:EAL domain-containing protein (putative c-di-GMP-specific phosphodiesterase class I)